MHFPLDDILQEFLLKCRPTISNNEEMDSSSLSIHPSPPPLPDAGITANQFTIPVLPVGSQLTFFINSTWGDRYYVGLTGIEIFTDNGANPLIEEVSIISPALTPSLLSFLLPLSPSFSLSPLPLSPSSLTPLILPF